MNILILPIGKRTYMLDYFKEALAGRGTVHAASSSYGDAFFAADASFITPDLFSENFRERVLEYCLENKISAIFPLTDFHAAVLSKAKEEFLEHNIRILVGEPWMVETCNDKWLTFQFMKKHGIPTPRTYLAAEDFIKAERSGEISFPVILKPRVGIGGVALLEAQDREEFELFSAVLPRILLKTYLRPYIPGDLNPVFIIQEKVEGDEYGADIVNDIEGQYKAAFIRKKLGIQYGESNPIIFEYIGAIEQVGEKISSLLRHPGAIDVDLIVAGGDVYVIEINARLGGAYPYSQLAGAHLPRAIVRWLRGEEVDSADLTIRYGTYCYKETIAKTGSRQTTD